MAKFFMKLNFVGIVCTTAVLLYLLVTCTTANADDGFCCQQQPCTPVYIHAQVPVLCNGYKCIIEFSAYEECQWFWCTWKSQDPLCRSCMINAAEQDPVALQRYYEMDVIPSSVPGSATTCPDSCINSIMIDGNITYQVPCSPALPNKP